MKSFANITLPKSSCRTMELEFNNQILDTICAEYAFKKCNVMTYHPASNGMVERQNREIIQHLRT